MVEYKKYPVTQSFLLCSCDYSHIPPIMNVNNISAIDQTLETALQQKIDTKTKPLGALGLLEDVALKIGLIQQTLTPHLNKPAMVVFAGDHGIAHEGVSPFPPEVTPQMVLNFLSGGAAINIFCRQHGITIKVVDAGVNFEFTPHPDLINAKIANGTQNYLHKPAMTLAQTETALQRGGEIVHNLHATGCNIIGFGEMGISNTSSAAILMSLLTNTPIEQCVGRGTGLDDAGVQHKIAVLSQAITNHAIEETDPLTVLATFGGFEIAMMCGAFLKAAELGMVVLVDGFIATSALLVAVGLNQHILDYCIFTHQSDEHGHRTMLAYLKATPLLHLNLRLGEGSGVAVAYPLIVSAVNFLNEMASFESAGVSDRID